MATPTIPRNADELAEMLADPQRGPQVMETPKSLADFIDSYAQAQQGDSTELNKRIAEETQKQFAAMLRDNGFDADAKGAAGAIKRLDLDPQAKRRPNMLTSHKQGTAHNAAAPGAAVDQLFADGIDYMRNIWHKNTRADADKLGQLRNAASSVSPADGGFLVPEVLRSQLLEIALEMAVVRPLATVVPMDSARVPFPMIDSTTNNGSVFGGMVTYWGEEGAALTDSNPTFGKIELDAKKLTGLSVVPNELLQDSIISFMGLLERLWPQALAFEEDAKFQTGTGVGEPKGFRGAQNDAAIPVSRATSNEINYADVVNMYARMLPSSLRTAVWTCSQEAIPQLLQMALSVGTGGNSVFVVNASEDVPMRLFGRPLIVTEKAGTLGARGDLAFTDLGYYLVGDRQTMTADSSTDWKFGSDKTAFRIIQRVDAQPWLKSAITPQNGGNTLSPFIELAA